MDYQISVSNKNKETVSYGINKLLTFFRIYIKNYKIQIITKLDENRPVYALFQNPFCRLMVLDKQEIYKETIFMKNLQQSS